MRTTKRGKFAAIAVGLAVVTAACGDDEKKSDDTTAETSEPISPLGPSLSPSPLIRLMIRPPMNDPAMPATKAIVQSTWPPSRPRMNCAAAPTTMPVMMIPMRSTRTRYRLSLLVGESGRRWCAILDRSADLRAVSSGSDRPQPPR